MIAVENEGIDGNGIHQKTTITLVGKGQAKVGYSFIYQGPVSDCRECILKNICFNLEKGRRYTVIKVRDKEHPCRISNEGVRVVEVENIPFKGAIPGTMVIEGSVIKFHPQGCGRKLCRSRNITNPNGLEENTRIKILKVLGDATCEHGVKYKEAIVNFAD